MDVVTHAMVGVVIASPVFPAAPLTAGCFVLGSVLPDADSLARVFGKAAFIRWHQTFTHSLPLIAAITLPVWLLFKWLGVDEPWAAPAIAGAMCLHVLMDATNTFGVTLLTPLSRKRYCAEWIFLIDGIMIAVTAGCLAVVLLQFHRGQLGSPALVVGYGCFVVAYWTMRWLVHRRAMRLAPAGTLSVVPSAFLPWQFLACRATANDVEVFELSAIRGETTTARTWHTFDGAYEKWLSQVVEYCLMRGLSPGYRAVEVAQSGGKTSIVCRDLRIRNFGGTFGRLELEFDADGRVVGKRFYA